MEQTVSNNNANPSCPELGMLKMPDQQWANLYDLSAGLQKGTIFPDLDKPFYMGGVVRG